MKPIMILLLVASTNAMAQQRTFYDANGRVAGKETTHSNGSTTIYDKSGRVQGRTSTDSQGTTTIYGADGRKIGRRGNRPHAARDPSEVLLGSSPARSATARTDPSHSPSTQEPLVDDGKSFRCYCWSGWIVKVICKSVRVVLVRLNVDLKKTQAVLAVWGRVEFPPLSTSAIAVNTNASSVWTAGSSRPSSWTAGSNRPLSVWTAGMTTSW